MNCVIIDEYRIVEHGLENLVSRLKVMTHYGPTGAMLGPKGYLPNRYVYIIPETDPMYILISCTGAGWHRDIDYNILADNGWI